MSPTKSINRTLEATKTVGTGAINKIAARLILIGKMASGYYVEVGFDEFVVAHRALDVIENNSKKIILYLSEQ